MSNGVFVVTGGYGMNKKVIVIVEERRTWYKPKLADVLLLIALSPVVVLFVLFLDALGG